MWVRDGQKKRERGEKSERENNARRKKVMEIRRETSISAFLFLYLLLSFF